MKIDFTSRVDDVMDVLGSHFGLGREDDRLPVELLMSSMIDCRADRPAYVLDTDWMTVSCHHAWFAFGGLLTPRHVGKVCAMRPRLAALCFEEWREDSPRVLVDCEYDKPPKFHLNLTRGVGGPVAEYVDTALRLPCRTPKVLPVPDARERLAAVVRSCVDSDLRRHTDDVKIDTPKDFAFYVELACAVIGRTPGRAPVYDGLASSLASAAHRLTALRGLSARDSRVTATAAWKDVARLLAGQVPRYTADCLRGVLRRADDGDAINDDMIRRSGESSTGPAAYALGSTWTRGEMDRLTAAGVLRRVSGARRAATWTIDEPQATYVRRLLEATWWL